MSTVFFFTHLPWRRRTCSRLCCMFVPYFTFECVVVEPHSTASRSVIAHAWIVCSPEISLLSWLFGSFVKFAQWDLHDIHTHETMTRAHVAFFVSTQVMFPSPSFWGFHRALIERSIEFFLSLTGSRWLKRPKRPFLFFVFLYLFFPKLLKNVLRANRRLKNILQLSKHFFFFISFFLFFFSFLFYWFLTEKYTRKKGAYSIAL